MKIIWHSSPNFFIGRIGMSPWAIVDHTTASSMRGCLDWLCNPHSQSSAHYLVTREGEVYQLVKDEDTAWSNCVMNRPSWPLALDNVNPNRFTLSIEHEGQPHEALAEEQYQASLALHRQLCAKWSIPRDRLHIVGHSEIDSVNHPNCPGPAFPWQRLIKDLRRVRVYIDGQEKDSHAELRNGRVMVDSRIAEDLGYNVLWNGTELHMDVKRCGEEGAP